MAGLLDYLKEQKDAAMNDYSGLLGNYPNAQKFAQSLLGNIEKNIPSNADLRSPERMGEWSLAAAMNAPMGLAIKAYHGSPYKFDKFDMSKIGTGEGAQAYGHGLYFAENPEVAKEYMKVDPSVDAPLRRSLMGTEYEPGTWEYKAASLLSEMPLKSARKMVSGWIDTAGINDDVQGYKTVLELLNRATSKADSKVLKPEKQLYETSLQWPDAAKETADPLGPQHFLDWDKPLSEQPESIAKSINDAGLMEYANKYFQKNKKENPTAADLHDFLKYGGYDQREISAKLANKGIPGIRYLDGGSRGAGNGTYNYVVFDDQIPKIVERNGQKITGLLGE